MTLGAGLAGGLGATGLVAPTPAHAEGRASTERRRWARDTWRSLAAMADPRTGLVADNIDADLATRSGYTSPTNIGGYLWSALVAREWRIIGADECTALAAQRPSRIPDHVWIPPRQFLPLLPELKFDWLQG